MWLCQMHELGFESLNIFFETNVIKNFFLVSLLTSFFMPTFSHKELRVGYTNTNDTKR